MRLLAFQDSPDVVRRTSIPLGLALLLAVSAAGCGSHAGRGRAVHKQLLWKSDDPAWSPDGRKNAHALGVEDGQSPAWSPDSKRIAFTTFRDNPEIDELFVVNADGTNQRPLTGQ
jgi:WD40-like Beta Propeller Repeat